MTQILSSPILRLDQSWAYKVTVLADLLARRVTAIVQEASGLNLSQWRVLAAIGDQPGRTASEVVKITPMDKGIVSRGVTSLAQKELITRRASETDGRLSHLYLTETGEAIYQAIVEKLHRAGLIDVGLLTEGETESLLELLQQAIQASRERDEPRL